MTKDELDQIFCINAANLGTMDRDQIGLLAAMFETNPEMFQPANKLPA